MDSRLTFRDKQDGVCHQKLIRDKAGADASIAVLFPGPAAPRLKAARVRQVKRALAWKVISRYEWLGTLPNCTWYYGIFFDDYCGGVSCIKSDTGAGIATAKFLGVNKGEVAYLARGACVHWAPKGTAPKLINRSINMPPGCKVAIAYSDTDAGEIGTVYQAAGWYYIGKGASVVDYVSPHGRVYANKILYDIRRTNKGRITMKEVKLQLLAKGWKEQRSNGKLRYVQLTQIGKKDKALVQHIESMSQQYLKRAGSIAADALTPPGERGRVNTDPGAPTASTHV